MNIKDIKSYNLYNNIIKKLNGDAITEQDVWVEARGYIYFPDMEKIFFELSSNKIKELLYSLMEERLSEDAYTLFENSFNISFMDINNNITIKYDTIETIDEFVQAVNFYKGAL